MNHLIDCILFGYSFLSLYSKPVTPAGFFFVPNIKLKTVFTISIFGVYLTQEEVMGRKKQSELVRVGDVFSSPLFGDFLVLKYEGSKSILVRFSDTGYETETTLSQVISGSVKDRLSKTVCGVGFIGDGDYKPSWMGRKPYLVWRCMLHRCYVRTASNKAYLDCEVDSYWHNFQNFAKWFDDNWPKDGKMYELDKDIKVKGNRIYSPDTCMFVTRQENLKNKPSTTDVEFTMVNGISGYMKDFNSYTEASKFTGKPVATIHRIVNERLGKCTSDGWFALLKQTEI